MKRILIITTHFAPDWHVGAKRPTKFAKFLPEFGWEPVIITREEKYYHGIDYSLCGDLSNHVKIFRVREWRLSNNTDSTESADGDGASETTGRIFCKLIPFVKKFIGWLFIYDFGWIWSAFYKGVRLVKEQGIDVLFSTAPDPEAHIVALGLKIVTGKPWVADFRDPWTALHVFYRPGRFKRALDRLCEKVVVATADHITAISHTLARNLDKLRDYREKDSVSVIYNGYDEEDFNKIDHNQFSARPFTITYLGTWGSGRSPEPFLRALSKLLVVNPNLNGRIRVNFAGEVKFDPQMHARIQQVILKENLDGAIMTIPFLPYRRGLDLLRNGDVSLLVVSPYHSRVGCLSSKLFEYLYAGKPILALAPSESEEAQIICKAGAGQVVVPDDVTAISRKIEEMYMAFQNGDKVADVDSSEIEKYERRRQTQELAAIFDSLMATGAAHKADIAPA